VNVRRSLPWTFPSREDREKAPAPVTCSDGCSLRRPRLLRRRASNVATRSSTAARRPSVLVTAGMTPVASAGSLERRLEVASVTVRLVASSGPRVGALIDGCADRSLLGGRLQVEQLRLGGCGQLGVSRPPTGTIFTGPGVRPRCFTGGPGGSLSAATRRCRGRVVGDHHGPPAGRVARNESPCVGLVTPHAQHSGPAAGSPVRLRHRRCRRCGRPRLT
jgi:hypothetical protein